MFNACKRIIAKNSQIAMFAAGIILVVTQLAHGIVMMHVYLTTQEEARSSPGFWSDIAGLWFALLTTSTLYQLVLWVWFLGGAAMVVGSIIWARRSL